MAFVICNSVVLRVLPCGGAAALGATTAPRQLRRSCCRSARALRPSALQSLSPATCRVCWNLERRPVYSENPQQFNASTQQSAFARRHCHWEASSPCGRTLVRNQSQPLICNPVRQIRPYTFACRSATLLASCFWPFTHFAKLLRTQLGLSEQIKPL